MNTWSDHVWHDVRFGLRVLRRSPGFTALALLSIALAVAASTAIFSIVEAVLLRPLPFPEPDRLVRILFNEPHLGLSDIPFSLPELEDLRTRSGVFEQVLPLAGGSVNLAGPTGAERLEFVVSSPDYFAMLGAAPEIGRLFGPQDFARGFAPVAVISDGLWRRSFGADRSIIGRTVRLDNDPYTIVGVVQRGFRHPGATISGNVDAWLTAGFSADPFPTPLRSHHAIAAGIGRLRTGITVEAAQARLGAMATALRAEFPGDYPAAAQWTIQVRPLKESLVGNVRRMLLVLLAAVILIVFVVSLNLANLLLARAIGRQHEIAVRLALGATRGRVVQQLLTESALLAAVGGTAGVMAAFNIIDAITRFVPANLPRLDQVRIDGAVLAFALGMSIATALIFSVAPALQAAKVGIVRAVREGSRGSGDSVRMTRFRDLLVVSELALAVVLMVGAGLLFRTLRELVHENPGFNPTQMVTAQVWLPVPNNPNADPYVGNQRKNTFDRELLRRVRAFPGIESAALTSNLPTTAQTDRRNFDRLVIEDRPNEASEDMHAERIRVTPDYFRVLQAQLVRGRFFTESDDDGRTPVAIVDESTARRFWAGQDPLGRRVRFGPDPAQPWVTVVGVVGDLKQSGLDVDGAPHVYVSLYQNGDRTLGIVMRTSLQSAGLEPEIRGAVRAIDGGVTVFGVASMSDVIDRSLASRRFSANLVSGFAAVALVLAFVGIYGVLSFVVGQRSREIGLRMALGASRSSVLRLFLRRGVMLAAIGIAAGLVVSASTSSILASLVYGIRPRDPLVFLAVPLTLLVIAIVASYVPARRATKIDPMVALRD